MVLLKDSDPGELEVRLTEEEELDLEWLPREVLGLEDLRFCCW